MTLADKFAPYSDLAAHLIPHACECSADASHDLSHILRVWANVQMILRHEAADQRVLTAACLLHDCVAVEKSSPLRATASRLAAEKAKGVLEGLDWEKCDISEVYHAIEAHSFSARVTPQTVEAQILQDADRLDAIGHIGIARCFYVSGRLNRDIYDMADPRAENRALDDTQFAVDHFYTKLLRLSDGFHTETARAIAAKRHSAMEGFLQGLLAEVSVGA